MRTNRIYEIRLIVAGSRTFHDYKLAKEKLDRIVFGLQEDYPGAHIVIISGDAKMAGPMRNAQMMSYAKEGIPALVAFWDGKSRGTKNMINTADNGRTFVRVIRYDS